LLNKPSEIDINTNKKKYLNRLKCTSTRNLFQIKLKLFLSVFINKNNFCMYFNSLTKNFYYNEGGRKGVAFAVDATGLHGKIVALDDCAAQTTTWTSDKRLRKVLLSATDRADGAKNQAAVEQVADWQTKYPPFARCASLGKGWYLPAVDEIAPLCREGEVRNVVGAMLSLRGKALDGLYHTSTEAGVGLVYNSAGEQVSKFAPEDSDFRVRAVSTF
jgi:hypothetical protein